MMRFTAANGRPTRNVKDHMKTEGKRSSQHLNGHVRLLNGLSLLTGFTPDFGISNTCFGKTCGLTKVSRSAFYGYSGDGEDDKVWGQSRPSHRYPCSEKLHLCSNRKIALVTGDTRSRILSQERSAKIAGGRPLKRHENAQRQ
jgi:hypothetical protein